MPVTASYIIAAVMVAPALVQSGVPDFAAHMFIFYYAVLSEVSPPTALSPFAAAALTGGNPFKTMMLTWKYTLPAFVVPFVFTLRPEGAGILLRRPGRERHRFRRLTAAAGIAALAGAFGGWLLGPGQQLPQGPPDHCGRLLSIWRARRDGRGRRYARAGAHLAISSGTGQDEKLDRTR